MHYNKVEVACAYLLGISHTFLKKDKYFVCLKSLKKDDIKGILGSFNVIVFAFKVDTP